MSRLGHRHLPTAHGRALGAALAIVAASLCAGCGARTELASSGAGPASPVPCGGASPGAKVWQVPLPSDQSFTGPWAVDDAGTTYFLGLGPEKYPTAYTVAAVDSCGALRWRSAPRPPAFLNGALPDLVVVGDRILFQWGTVDAFDRRTGAHLWNVDLDAFAGEKLALDDWTEIGPLTAAADGTAFLTMMYHGGAVILSIDAAGTIRTMVPNVAGPLGDVTGFLLDADDHLDVLYNTTQGAIVDAYARDGSKVFSRTFMCTPGFISSLAAGSSFVVMQSGPCGMDLADASQFSPPAYTSVQSVTIDAANNLYVNGTTALTGLDAGGSPRWTAPGSDLVVSDPLLATGGLVLTARLPADIAHAPGPVSVVANDAATGAEVARYPTDAVAPAGLIPLLSALVTPAAQFVFGVGGTATAIAIGETADTSAQWPTAVGGPDRRNAAMGH